MERLSAQLPANIRVEVNGINKPIQVQQAGSV
jgi:hypothetical protein